MSRSPSAFSLSAADTTLGGIVVGPEYGRLLLVVHGGPGESHDSLRPQLDALASDERRVVYYDQRGGSRSPLAHGAAPGDWRSHVADLDAVRRHFVPGPVDILGFSWGALLAVLYALEHRDDVARLVLVSPPPMHGASSDQMRRDVAAACARPEVRDVEARARQAASDATDPAARARAAFVARIAAVLSDPARAWDLTPSEVREDAARAVWSSLGAYDLRPRLPALRDLPILIVGGVEDPVTASTIADTASGLGARLALLDHCGHAPFCEAPEEFRRTVDGFLGSR